VQRLVILLFVLIAFADSAFATVSFNGTFITDDQIELFSFNVGAANTVVTMLTYGYGGGTNGAGTVIPSGGFDPILTLFDPAQNEVGFSDGGNCSHNGQHARPVIGCADDYMQQTLGIGTYILALSVYSNYANGPLFSDGFAEAGQGNFTCGFVGSGSGAFCDPQTQDNGNWAVDIIGINSAQDVTGVPEPASSFILLSGLTTIYFLRRRYQRRLYN
jgi:hypothetical protein